MGFFDFLFGKKKSNARAAHEADGLDRPSAPSRRAVPPAPPAAQAAPGTQIAYDPDLVPHLKADHKQLLELFGMINAAFSSNDLPATAKLLDDFRSKIQAHLLTENIRFYIYLEHSLSNDLTSSAMVHDFRQEMDGIGKAVLEFMNKYKDIGTRPDFSIPFGKDLASVGKVLVDRIEREEKTLYPLYFQVY